MSDNIPFEIQVEIIKRLPVKSLIQFRSVSKAWKSLIDSSVFIANYNAQQTEPQHLLISHSNANEETLFSVFEDYTFPQQIVTLTAPRFPYSIENYIKIGCSHGLLCLYGVNRVGRVGHQGRSGIAVIWNLSIRKAVAVVVTQKVYFDLLGFGVCRETTDPKIVKVTRINMESALWLVEVFTLSTGAWKTMYSNLPRESIKFRFPRPADVDGVLYWLAYDEISVDGGYKTYSLLISFDLKTQEFGEVNLPECLAEAFNTNCSLQISKLMNSLVVIELDFNANNKVYGVWMMEDGVQKSFTKLYTVDVNTQNAYIIGYRKSSAPIVQIRSKDHEAQLVVYEPNLKPTNSFLSIHSRGHAINVYPYMETLLLLDQPDLMVYNDI